MSVGSSNDVNCIVVQFQLCPASECVLFSSKLLNTEFFLTLAFLLSDGCIILS